MKVTIQQLLLLMTFFANLTASQAFVQSLLTSREYPAYGYLALIAVNGVWWVPTTSFLVAWCWAKLGEKVPRALTIWIFVALTGIGLFGCLWLFNYTVPQLVGKMPGLQP
ncbi:MAG: hypothetical protein R3C53_11045 [Pirellulaceae bacterium]